MSNVYVGETIEIIEGGLYKTTARVGTLVSEDRKDIFTLNKDMLILVINVQCANGRNNLSFLIDGRVLHWSFPDSWRTNRERSFLNDLKRIG